MMSRKDYNKTAEILNYISTKTHPAVFSYIVNEFAVYFANDNERFDVNRFHKASNYRVPQVTQQRKNKKGFGDPPQ